PKKSAAPPSQAKSRTEIRLSQSSGFERGGTGGGGTMGGGGGSLAAGGVPAETLGRGGGAIGGGSGGGGSGRGRGETAAVGGGGGIGPLAASAAGSALGAGGVGEGAGASVSIAWSAFGSLRRRASNRSSRVLKRSRFSAASLFAPIPATMAQMGTPRKSRAR